MNELTNFNLNDSDREKTRIFVASVMQLYNIDLDVRRMEGFSALCKAHHSEISKMTTTEYNQRLNKIKKITAVPNFKGLNGNYFTAQNALRIACADITLLNHDFYLIYPHNVNNQALNDIRNSELEERDKEIAKKTLNQLKNLF